MFSPCVSPVADRGMGQLSTNRFPSLFVGDMARTLLKGPDEWLFSVRVVGSGSPTMIKGLSGVVVVVFFVVSALLGYSCLRIDTAEIYKINTHYNFFPISNSIQDRSSDQTSFASRTKLNWRCSTTGSHARTRSPQVCPRSTEMEANRSVIIHLEMPP